MADETCTPCDDVIDICINTGPPGPRGSVGKITQFIFYPPVGTTDITGTDKSGNLMEVDPDGCLVSINGVMLEPGADYTIAPDGLTVTLSEGIVNANDVLTVQTWKSDEQATDDVLDLKLDVEKNTSDIAGLDVRVTQNEGDIETLQNAAQSFTTRDVKVSGVNTTRAVDENLKTQQDINLFLDDGLGKVEDRLDEVESGQPTLDADLEDLRNDTDENTQGISDNATAINDLTDIVSDNVDDITSLQEQVNNLPPPTDISELEEDVDDIAKQVGSNTIAIAKNASDIAALPEMTIDLEPLSEAIETNAAGISVNASDIKDIKDGAAKQQSEINDLKADVIELQGTEFDTDGLAVVDEDNEFSASQTIKDGVTITGSQAFLNLDKGSPLSISNGNFSNSVVEIKRSTGDTAISLEASGHIRGVKTDTDPSCAVSLEYFQANVGAGGDVDMSLYATKLELTDEEKARILGDQKLAADLDEAIKTEKYNDQELRNKISAEEKARAAGDSTLTNQIANETKYRQEEDAKLQKAIDELEIPGVDPDLYATVEYVDNLTADFATENFVEEAIGAIEFPDLPEGLATETYVDEAIEAIPEVSLDGLATEEFVTNAIDAIEFPAGTILSDDAPEDAEEGDYWFDTNRLELFIYYQDAWITTTPLGAKIDEAEAIQRQIIEQVNDSVDKQDNLVRTVNDRARVQDALVVSTKLLSDKVDALEGSTLDAKYKADARDNPQTGAFVLQDADGNKVLQFSAAEKIELSKTDFTNKVVDLSQVMNGDIVRLVMTADNYANYTITSVESGDETFTLGLTFGSSGSEEIVFDGAVYDFTHATPFDPEAFATIDYVDAQADTKVGKTGDQEVASGWKIKSGGKTFMSVGSSLVGLYHVKDPTDDEHPVTLGYATSHYANKHAANTFTDTQTFEKSTYFQNTIVQNSKNNDTLTEVRGEHEEMKQLWHKIRATSKVSWIAYPGQTNTGYKRIMDMWWDDGLAKPQCTITYLTDPTSNGDAANKRYVDQEIAKVGGGSDGATAKSGTTTPNLDVGEMFFNTTSKILFIGDGS